MATSQAHQRARNVPMIQRSAALCPCWMGALRRSFNSSGSKCRSRNALAVPSTIISIRNTQAPGQATVPAATKRIPAISEYQSTDWTISFVIISYSCARRRPSSVKGQMPEFLRVHHRIDRADLSASELDRDRLDAAVLANQDEARQTVNRRGMPACPGTRQVPLAGQASVEADDAVPPANRIEGCTLVAARIGVENSVLGQKRREPGYVARAQRVNECARQCLAPLIRNREAWPCGPDMRPGPGGELAASRFRAVERRGDLGEVDAEHVVQQEGRALQRGQPFQREHEREGQVISPLAG